MKTFVKGIKRPGGRTVEVEHGAFSSVIGFPITFDDVDLEEGIPFYLPKADDVASGLWLLNAWFEISEAWNGTTPKGNVGTFSGTTEGLLSIGGAINDMTLVSTEQVGAGLKITNQYALSYANNGSPVRITAPNPLKVVVSQTGDAGGASPGATQGKCILCYLIGKA